MPTDQLSVGCSIGLFIIKNRNTIVSVLVGYIFLCIIQVLSILRSYAVLGASIYLSMGIFLLENVYFTVYAIDVRAFLFVRTESDRSYLSSRCFINSSSRMFSGFVVGASVVVNFSIFLVLPSTITKLFYYFVLAIPRNPVI